MRSNQLSYPAVPLVFRLVVEVDGFEPPLRGPESLVLPLHHTSIYLRGHAPEPPRYGLAIPRALPAWPSLAADAAGRCPNPRRYGLAIPRALPAWPSLAADAAGLCAWRAIGTAKVEKEFGFATKSLFFFLPRFYLTSWNGLVDGCLFNCQERSQSMNQLPSFCFSTLWSAQW